VVARAPPMAMPADEMLTKVQPLAAIVDGDTAVIDSTRTTMSTAPDASPYGATCTLSVFAPATASEDERSHVIWEVDTAVTCTTRAHQSSVRARSGQH
jgi:hypothetical protein